jgi:hypothetical protein
VARVSTVCRVLVLAAGLPVSVQHSPCYLFTLDCMHALPVYAILLLMHAISAAQLQSVTASTRSAFNHMCYCYPSTQHVLCVRIVNLTATSH